MAAEILDPSAVDLSDPFAKVVYLLRAWMEDRSLIQGNNTTLKIIELLCFEISEFLQAHRDKRLDVEKFDEIPGELADILIFATTWYLKNGKDPIPLLQEFHTKTSSIHDRGRSRQNSFSIFILEHLYMSQIKQAMDKIKLKQESPLGLDTKKIQEGQMRFLLEAVFLYAALHQIDLATEAPEKIAFNSVRYTAKAFTLLPGEVYSVSLYEERRKEAKKETKNRGWKEMFYEIPKPGSHAGVMEKRARPLSAAKLALGRYAGAFFSLFR